MRSQWLLKRLQHDKSGEARNHAVTIGVIQTTRRSDVGLRFVEQLDDRLAPANLLHSLFPDAFGPQQGSQFGQAIAADSNFQVIGAPLSDVSGIRDVGQAFVYNAANGALVVTLNNPSPADNDQFGRYVAVSGNSVVIGATFDDTGATDAGSAYVFNAITGALVATLNNPFPTPGDFFGSSVAMSGNSIVVGAPSADIGATNAGSAYMFNADDGTFVATLSNPNPAINDLFGGSVAVSGNSIVVGTAGADTGATNAGSAYVFDAATAALVVTLNNPTPSSEDQFGHSVAVSGNNVVVGAIYDDTGATDAGSAYVFNVTTGALLATLNNPTPAGGDNFADSVAVSSNNVVIGAWHDDTGDVDAGSAYVFNATTGVLVTTLSNPTPTFNDLFGFRVAVSGDAVVVGEIYGDVGDMDVGSAFVFNATTGAAVATLNNPTPEVFDVFGWSSAVSGNVVVVGAYQDDTGAPDSGAAYVFDAPTGALIATLTNPSPATGDWFGFSVAVSGNIAVVGAYQDDTGATNAGSAYVFDATTGALVATLVNPTPFSNDIFGWSVAVSGNTAVVGARFDNTGAQEAGSAYIFNATTGALIATLNNPTPAIGDHFGNSVAVSGSRVVVGAFRDDTGANGAGSAYVFNVTTGALVATLNNPSPAGSSHAFGVSVAVSGNNVVVGAYEDGAGVPDAGRAYVFDATSGALITPLNNPTPVTGDHFGNSVSASGNIVLVGAYQSLVGATMAGMVHVFDATSGGLVSTLSNPTSGDIDNFGISVGVSGDIAVVGAYFDDTQNTDQGAAYVYSLGAVTATVVGPVTPDPRNTSVASVQVVLSQTVDLSTFTAADFTLTRNGGANLLTGSEAVTFVSGTTYQIGGLAALTGLAGSYQLTVNMAGVNDLAGNPGVGSASDSWVVDLTAPVANGVFPVVPNPRNVAVSQIDFTFSEPIDLATLTAADLTLTRGGPNLLTGAETVTLVSGSTYRISGLASLTAADGGYTLTVAGAGVQDLAGNVGTGSASTSWTMDTVGPKIVGLYFDGTTWTGGFRSAAGSSNYGYPAQTGAGPGGQLTALPWSTVNTFWIQFSEDVGVQVSDLGIRGVNVPSYSVASFSYDNINFVGKWTLAANVDTDWAILDLDGTSGFAVIDAAGNKLGGTFNEGVSGFPTAGGNGVNFKYRFVVAVGDADRNGQVRNADSNLVRGNLFVDAGAGGYSIYSDIDGNGLTRNADLNAVRSHLFVDPPGGPGPSRPAPGSRRAGGNSFAFGRIDNSGVRFRSAVLDDHERGTRTLRRFAGSTVADALDALFEVG